MACAGQPLLCIVCRLLQALAIFAKRVADFELFE